MNALKPLGRAIRSVHDQHRTTWWSAALVTLALSGGYALAACAPCSPCRGQCRAGQQCKAGCSPCSPKEGCCAANPCASPCSSEPGAANPCAGKNPCAIKSCTPCCSASCNPCSSAAGQGTAPNPCAARKVMRPANYEPYEGNPCALVAQGERLFNDTSLSTNGLACSTCHNNDAGYNATFANAYPHSVAMARTLFGMDEVHLDEMVQVCMVQPMAAEPLGWNGEALAALVAYMEKVQQRVVANPCALGGGKSGACTPCRPCAGKNPCASKKPCASRNPCASSTRHADEPARNAG